MNPAEDMPGREAKYRYQKCRTCGWCMIPPTNQDWWWCENVGEYVQPDRNPLFDYDCENHVERERC